MTFTKEKDLKWPKDDVERSKIVAQLAVGAAILIQNGLPKSRAYSAVLECYADLEKLSDNKDPVKNVKDL